MKAIKVIKEDKTYIVKLFNETVDNLTGITIKVFQGGESIMKHFLDFSKHPATEREKNIIKFIENFNEEEASEWVNTL